MRTCFVKASKCASLVSCLPALERVVLVLSLLTRDDLGGLLEALAWCPRLRALDLSVECFASSEGDLHWPLPYASAFAKLSSLTTLGLEFDEEKPFTLADVVGALVPLTGLVELDLPPTSTSCVARRPGAVQAFAVTGIPELGYLCPGGGLP